MADASTMREVMSALSITALFALAGCSAVPADPSAEVERVAAPVDEAAQDVLSAIYAAGLADGQASGHLEQCGGSLTGWGGEYQASASAAVGDDLQTAIDRMTTGLQSSGWTYIGELGGDYPSARLERGDVTIDLMTGGFTVGETRYGAEELEVGITTSNACVTFPEGEHVSDYPEFERTILPRD
ncbi:hypothetical protein ACI3KS_08785 [Microbacterium sp. ZW T5_45]|uniref:hypothetical protein n=1 Tax=Microbacterium sp. ZW T5_45 TaxID=3378080 RepID=UPI00385262D4